jgi:tetratricopeptide (TPR) repeat protein
MSRAKAGSRRTAVIRNGSVLSVAPAGVLLGILGAFAAGCGGGPPAETGGVKEHVVVPVAAVSQETANKFNVALDAFNAHDKAGDWSDPVCAQMAADFESAASQQKGGKLPAATYDAGLAYQRCGDDKSAKAHFQEALAEDPKNSYARAQLALYQFKADNNEDAAIAGFQQAVLDAQFQNVPALTDLAMFQMQRDSAQGGQGCKDDFDCAKQNLQRALAIDDGYMPAFNQLALLYFQAAKKRAGAVASSRRGRSMATNASIAKRADVQQLELAALVCSQAIRKNPNYAPIHNTAGLIQNELGQINGAVAEFANAAKLDPHFFEAQMNYAAVNLSFRGFAQAQGAYEKAIEMRKNDYDAHLGLALALRGQIDVSGTNYDQQVAAVQSELDACKKIDESRPDVYYNEGILTQEYKAKAGGGKDATITALNAAKAIFQKFVDRASGKAEYEGAVKRSKERMQDIDDTITFLNTGAAPEPTAPAAPAPGTSGAAAPTSGPSSAAPDSAAAAPAGSAPAAPAPAGGAPTSPPQ